MDRPKPPPPPYVSMRNAAEKLRFEPDAGEVLANTDEAALLATILDHLATDAQRVSGSGGFIDHEPYLSATALAKKILGL